MMIRKYLFTSALIIITITLNGQKEGLKYINKADLKAYMTFFASDEMKGRETGTIENDIASLYLSTNIMRLGLQPIPETGNYIQKVPLVSYEIKQKETFLKINDISGGTIFTTDSIVYLMPPSKTTDATGKFVFIGFGLQDTATGYDDYQGIDIKGKIVLLMTGRPDESAAEASNSVFNMGLEFQKIMTAYQHGAMAVLCVYDPRNKYADAFSSGLADMGPATVGSKMFSLDESDISAPIQVAFITRHAADQILKSGGNTLKTLQEKISQEKKSSSMELNNITVTFRTYIEATNINSSNIIGFVEGSDPVMRNECVIYTAHFDHVGVNSNGEIFNGADDNASGSMALLEVAQAFVNLKKKPLRSVVFAWVNGEEKGLLGSIHYTDKPLFSLDKTLLNINLDMVGRSKMPSDTGTFMGFEVNVSGAGEILLYTDQKGRDLLDLIESASATAGIKTLNKGKDPPIGSSDYASFMERGVPAVCFNSGDYPDLHTIRDDVDKIDFDKMEKVSKMVFLLGYDVANQKKRFVPDTIE